MAQTTVYTCDICKQSKSKNDLARLSIEATGIHLKGINKWSSLDIDVCPNCLKKKGFIIEYKTDEELAEIEAKNIVTLEDKIYDFLLDMGVMFEE